MPCRYKHCGVAVVRGSARQQDFWNHLFARVGISMLFASGQPSMITVKLSIAPKSLRSSDFVVLSMRGAGTEKS